MATQKETIDSITIEGDKKFVVRTKNALKLLKSKAPLYYTKTVLPYIKKIKPFRTSGMNLFGKVPTYEVGSKTAFYALKWFASTIVHDAYHAKLYFDYKKRFKKKVPAKIYKSPEAELKCIKVQIGAARKIKLNLKDINYLKTLTGNHAKLKKINW